MELAAGTRGFPSDLGTLGDKCLNSEAEIVVRHRHHRQSPRTWPRQVQDAGAATDARVTAAWVCTADPRLERSRERGG